MNTLLRFEKGRREDAEQIAELNRQFHLDVPEFFWDTLEWIRQELTLGNYYVLSDEKGMAGAICLQVCEDTIVIQAIALRPDLQRDGLGRALIFGCEAMCLHDGATLMLVEPFCAYELDGFFEACGYTRPADQVNHYQGAEFYLFSKPLAM